MAVFTNLSEIPMFHYDLIMADPPWLFGNWSKKGEKKNATSQYDCIPEDGIRALRVADFAAKDCVLWLWATNPLIDVQIDVMKAWGFKFVTSGHWAKFTKASYWRDQNVVSGKQHFGTGYCLRSAGEPFIIGAIGSPTYAKKVRSVLMAPAREHSRKPEEAYAAAETLAPMATKRLDLFSRQVRPGWDCFGNEVGKFEEVTA
ncbi:DNA methyltransferase [Shimia sp. R9_2]|uniref:MT-A70 family methyltransferase n=1 Tax=Shimia sp. R9_2 TaxID=2821112 RepID=UPI001ADAB42D|nr:MT-A70 family methyltransferase [Shimia sp. R9_2]MBO9398748.1 DNA methyltransferase [Shimia sp. R9_2]